MIWLAFPLVTAVLALAVDLHFQETDRYEGGSFGETDVFGATEPRVLTLPPLPYGSDALEPVLGAETVTLHHDVHQRAYVEGANRAMRSLTELEEQSLEPELRQARRRSLTRDLAFNAAGAILHQMYWENLSPSGANAPSEAFKRQVKKDFGSMASLETVLEDVGLGVQGSGWAVLVWSPQLDCLLVLQIGDHQNGWIPGTVPLLVIDIWEHSYYLDDPASRSSYLRKLFSRIDWSVTSARFTKAVEVR